MLEIKLDAGALGELEEAIKAAALETMEAVKTDLLNSHTVPFQNGTLQGTLDVEQNPVGEEIHTALETDMPYARFLYFGHLMVSESGSSWAKEGETKHVTGKELDYQRGENPNAGPAWYAPYEAGGAKEDFIPETFADRMKEKLV